MRHFACVVLATTILITISTSLGQVGPGNLSQITPSQATPPPLGDLVDIGGRRLHLLCSGKGKPTVLIENGSSGFSIDWALVQPQVAKFSHVCTYDRAGFAWSDPGPEFDTV